MIDYRIRTFLELYETMNYRRAGERLGLSQPAVSQQIRALESEYGCRLFHYDGKRLHQTPQAHQLADYARSALYNDQQLRRELQQTPRREIRIGVTRTIGAFVIQPVLIRYLKRSSENLSVTVDNTEILLHKLEHEDLDFALVEGIFDKERYAHVLYQKAPFVGLCSVRHPFAGRTISLQELTGETAVLREQGSGTRAILEKTLAEQGYSLSLFSRVICANNPSLIFPLVAEGIGITFAYAAAAKGRKDLVPFHLSCMDEHREFQIVYLKNTNLRPLIEEVIGAVPVSPLPENSNPSPR